MILGLVLGTAFAADSDGVEAEALAQAVERLRPHVERLEGLDRPPTRKEVATLLATASELDSMLETRESEVEGTGIPGESEPARQARRMYVRVRGLELLVDVREFDEVVEEAVAQEQLTPETIHELGTRALALVDRLHELRARLDSTPADRDEESASPTSQDAPTSTDSIAGELGRARQTLQAASTWDDAPESLRRCRRILNRIAAIEVTGKVERIQSKMEALEAEADSLTEQRLDPLRDDGEHLCSLIDAYERTAKKSDVEKPPPALIAGRDLCRRWSILDLRVSVSSYAPVVIYL